MSGKVFFRKPSSVFVFIWLFIHAALIFAVFIRNAPASAELKEFVEGLAKRAEALKRGRIDPREDNMLKITTEGRKAALDLRLMKPSLPDDPQSKVNLAVEKIQQIWEATKDDRLAQLVFCDLSTPQDRGFSVYRDMADKLKRLTKAGLLQKIEVLPGSFRLRRADLEAIAAGQRNVGSS